MNMRCLFGILSLMGVMLTGCSLLTEPGALDEGCSTGMKACFGKCVSKSDPAYGCGRPSCAPCALLHATGTTCNAALECTAFSCEMPFQDCDFDFNNGCESNIYEDVKNCNGCSKNNIDYDCNALVGSNVKDLRCGGGACYVYQCAAGWADADGDYRTGCEQPAASVGVDAGTP
jgi:hypothetical protein